LFDALEQLPPKETCTKKDLNELDKFLGLVLLGQIIGLPTLSSILKHLGITSNSRQIKYSKLCRKLTRKTIRSLFEFVFEQELAARLSELCQKDDSNWSRELVTVVVDDSVFRQWLENVNQDEDTQKYYGKFFSGQFRAAVYGFKIVTLGVSIDGVFYPLYFEPVAKESESNDEKKATKVAVKLIERWDKFRDRLRQRSTLLPILNLSCDSGYSDVELSNICQKNGLRYISVPKKSHKFEIDGNVQKLSEWIEEKFLKKETKHKEKCKKNNSETVTPFYWRVRAKYYTQNNREVTLLIFRLNGSKKVTAIYTTDKDIKAKTLRRHWFQRTYIEQFFKTLKHVLKIQESRRIDLKGFEMKLFVFSFVALHTQQLIMVLRKEFKEFRGKGFIGLQRLLKTMLSEFDWVREEMEGVLQKKNKINNCKSK
jgi:hypothetical protein